MSLDADCKPETFLLFVRASNRLCAPRISTYFNQKIDTANTINFIDDTGMGLP